MLKNVLNRKTKHAAYSVVIPLYNHESYIEQAVVSALQQTVPPREIVIVDDGSADRSFELVQRMALDEPRLVVWRQPNRGAHFTINAGIHRATSDIVAILNSDDCYERDRMAHCLGILQKQADVAAVASGVTCVDEAGRPFRNPWLESALNYFDHHGDLGSSLLNANFLLTTSNLVMRRALFEKIGFFASLRYVHDLEYFLRILRHGFRLEYLRKPLLRYRIHTQNTIKESQNKVRVEWAAVIALYMSAPSPGGLRPLDRSAPVLSMIRAHGLSALVQYMTWVCQESYRIGVAPFDHPDWERFAAHALTLR